MTDNVDAMLKQLRDMAADRLGVLDRAIELAKSLTGPDDPNLEQLSNLIREGDRMPSIVEELKRMLADVRAAPLPDNTGK
jgi:hypothetical protein